MTPEDEEFNRIEREAKQCMEAVSAALDKKSENARELGLDYGPVWGGGSTNKDYENAMRLKRLNELSKPAQPMHPEIKKMYEDYFDKCFRESSTAQRTWTGLTDDERRAARNSVAYNQFMTAGEYAEHVQKATEYLLKEKNS